MKPTLLRGNIHKDKRGSLYYNNSFDTSIIKRIYFIENMDTSLIRGWQGHKIEQRWFSAVQGSFLIKLIKIDNWAHPTKCLICEEFSIGAQVLDVLHIPKGYVTSIQSLEVGSRLLVMTDFLMGELNDEFRYDLNYFDN